MYDEGNDHGRDHSTLLHELMSNIKAAYQPRGSH